MPASRKIPLALIVISVLMIVARPWYGDFGLALFYLGPVLFGVSVCLLRLPVPIWREVLLILVTVTCLGMLHVGFQGVAEGSFYFDGDAGLVWIGVAVQVVNALIAYGVAVAVRELRSVKVLAERSADG